MSDSDDGHDDGEELPWLGERPRLGLLFRLLHQHYGNHVDAALREAGFGDIRPGHAKVFPFVPEEGIGVGELADRAGVRKQTMAQAVDQLARAGYVERRPHPTDARSRLVVLTEQGRRVGPVAVAAGQRVEERWAELVGPDELESLRAGLRHLLARVADAGG